MNDQRRRKIEEAWAEASLELLMDDYAEQSGETLWQEFQSDTECTMPEDLDAACQSLIYTSFDSMVQKSCINSISAHLKQLVPQACKAAMIAFALVGAMATLTLSVEAIRVPVFNFFIRHTDEYTANFSDVPQDSHAAVEDFTETLELLLPNGYTQIIHDCFSNGTVNLRYQDKSDHIVTLRTTAHDNQFRADTEDAHCSEITINGHTALYIEKNGKRIIIAQPENEIKIDFYAESIPDKLFWEIACVLAE